MKTALFPVVSTRFPLDIRILCNAVCAFSTKSSSASDATRTKQSLYTEEERKAQIEAIYQNNQRVSVAIYDTANCRFYSRNRSKFHFERSTHQTGF